MPERGVILSWQLKWILSRVRANLRNLLASVTAKRKAKTIYLFGISMTIFEVLICHAKVGHFAHIVVIKEDVSSCQVTMDYLPKDKDPKCKLNNKCMSFVRTTMTRGKIIQTFAWVVKTIVLRVFITDQTYTNRTVTSGDLLTTPKELLRNIENMKSASEKIHII